MTKSKTTQIKEYYTEKGEKRYYFKIYLGVDPLTGKPKYTTRRFKKLPEAKSTLNRMKFQKQNGTYFQQKAETYQEVYNLWIKQYERTVKESTFVKTIGIFENNILPKFGKYRISKIDYLVCQKHVNEWTDKFKKPSTIKSYASKVMNYAIKLGYIQNNPFSLTVITKKPKKYQEEETRENCYDKENLQKILECFKQEPNYKAYVFFHLLAYSGMRKGEAIALTWQDIDFDKKVIIIKKALTRGKSNQLFVSSTKTGDPRTISMGQETMEILKKWKEQQREEYNKLGFNTSKSTQLVFSNSRNEHLQHGQINKWLNQIIKKYALPKITPHGFRHTHCSLLLEADVDMYIVQERLGHSDIGTTMNTYAHPSKQAKYDAIAKFEDFMNE